MAEKNKPVLAIRDLAAGYGKRRILQNVRADICPGEVVGIIGPNGAGKSTLLKSLCGILPLAGGSVRLAGQPLDELSAAALARQAAYLPQAIEVPFSFTALDIVLTGRSPYLKWWQQESAADLALAQDCLRYTGMAEMAAVPLHAMSGGQRQRVLLARALAQQTRLLLLDEPTTGLDLVYQEEIFRLAVELGKAGRTLLIVVHDLSLAGRFCSRLLLLAKGRILADGAPDDVLTEPLLSEAYGAAIGVERCACPGHRDIYLQEPQELVTQQRRLLLRRLLTPCGGEVRQA